MKNPLPRLSGSQKTSAYRDFDPGQFSDFGTPAFDGFRRGNFRLKRQGQPQTFPLALPQRMIGFEIDLLNVMQTVRQTGDPGEFLR